MRWWQVIFLRWNDVKLTPEETEAVSIEFVWGLPTEVPGDDIPLPIEAKVEVPGGALNSLVGPPPDDGDRRELLLPMPCPNEVLPVE